MQLSIVGAARVHGQRTDHNEIPPFDKPIGDALTPNDLQVLIQHSVAEGYYVEYKRELPTAKEKIGKSIAALANTYGGWYIVDVQTDQHNVANNICGFSLTTYPDPISTVRDVIKSRVNPVPVFYPQVVTLGSNTVVLLVYVPEEQDTPFITKDGRIYRRVADSSDPVYEKDRYTIDQLYEHGRKNVQRFERYRLLMRMNGVNMCKSLAYLLCLLILLKFLRK